MLISNNCYQIHLNKVLSTFFHVLFTGGKTDFTCLKCSSASDRDCVENPDPKSTCNGTKGECFTFTYPPTNIVLRGCVGDADTPLSDELSRYSSICSSEPNCNNETITIEHCHSSKYSKQDLIDGMQTIEVKTCNVALTPLGCYFQHDSKSDTIETGCVSDLAEEDPKSDMQICIGPECNAKYTFMTCLTHKQQDVMKLHYDDVTINLCESVDDCFTYIYNGTLVERGCQSVVLPQTSDRCEDIKELCISCDNHIGCNRMGMIFSIDESTVLDDSSGSGEDDAFESAENEKTERIDEKESEMFRGLGIRGEIMPSEDVEKVMKNQEIADLKNTDNSEKTDDMEKSDASDSVEKTTGAEKTDEKVDDSEKTADVDKAKDDEKAENVENLEKAEHFEDTQNTDNIENSTNEEHNAEKSDEQETFNRSDGQEAFKKSEEQETFNKSEEQETSEKPDGQEKPEKTEEQENPEKSNDQQQFENDEKKEDFKNSEEHENSGKSVEQEKQQTSNDLANKNEPDEIQSEFETVSEVKTESALQSGIKPLFSTGSSGVDTMILVGLGLIVAVPLVAFIVFKYFARNSSRPKQPAHESVA